MIRLVAGVLGLAVACSAVSVVVQGIQGRKGSPGPQRDCHAAACSTNSSASSTIVSGTMRDSSVTTPF
jgi:hypothetical protein